MKKILITFIFFFAFFVGVRDVSAGCCVCVEMGIQREYTSDDNTCSNFAGSCDYLQSECTDPSNATVSPTSIPDPLGGATPQTLIGTIIRSVLGLVGSLALLMFVYGGLVWMTSQGNQDKVAKGKNILIWATIGIVLIFSSYAILRFVFESLGAI